jgi:hypothetical protein
VTINTGPGWGSLVVAEYRPIRFRTLEARSGLELEQWIADWNDELEPVTIEGAGALTIGDLEFRSVRWKCADCGRWNFELTFADPSGAIAVCSFCGSAGEW